MPQSREKIAEVYYAPSGKTAFVGRRFVFAERRRMGIGSALFKFFESQLRERGLKKVLIKTRQPITALFLIKNGYVLSSLKGARFRIPATVEEQIAFFKALLAKGANANQCTFSKEL